MTAGIPYYVTTTSDTQSATTMATATITSHGFTVGGAAEVGAMVGHQVSLADSWAEVRFQLGLKPRPSSTSGMEMRFLALNLSLLSDIQQEELSARIATDLLELSTIKTAVFAVKSMRKGSVIADVIVTSTASESAETITRDIWNAISSLQQSANETGNIDSPFRTVDPFFKDGESHEIVFTSCPAQADQVIGSNKKSTDATWSIPTARSHNNQRVTIDHVAGITLGASITKGTYLVRYQASSPGMDTQYCSFVASVTEKETSLLDASWGMYGTAVAIVMFSLLCIFVGCRVYRVFCKKKAKKQDLTTFNTAQGVVVAENGGSMYDINEQPFIRASGMFEVKGNAPPIALSSPQQQDQQQEDYAY